jgi:hypothetical protein
LPKITQHDLRESQAPGAEFTFAVTVISKTLLESLMYLSKLFFKLFIFLSSKDCCKAQWFMHVAPSTEEAEAGG